MLFEDVLQIIICYRNSENLIPLKDWRHHLLEKYFGYNQIPSWRKM